MMGYRSAKDIAMEAASAWDLQRVVHTVSFAKEHLNIRDGDEFLAFQINRRQYFEIFASPAIGLMRTAAALSAAELEEEKRQQKRDAASVRRIFRSAALSAGRMLLLLKKRREALSLKRAASGSSSGPMSPSSTQRMPPTPLSPPPTPTALPLASVASDEQKEAESASSVSTTQSKSSSPSLMASFISHVTTGADRTLADSASGFDDDSDEAGIDGKVGISVGASFLSAELSSVVARTRAQHAAEARRALGGGARSNRSALRSVETKKQRAVLNTAADVIEVTRQEREAAEAEAKARGDVHLSNVRSQVVTALLAKATETNLPLELFDILDPRKTGFVRIVVLFALLFLYCDGDLQKRTMAVFQLFDADDSNEIDPEELRVLLDTVAGLLFALGVLQQPLAPDELSELVTDCFTKADTDGGGTIDKEEFAEWSSNTLNMQGMTSSMNKAARRAARKRRFREDPLAARRAERERKQRERQRREWAAQHHDVDSEEFLSSLRDLLQVGEEEETGPVQAGRPGTGWAAGGGPQQVLLQREFMRYIGNDEYFKRFIRSLGDNVRSERAMVPVSRAGLGDLLPSAANDMDRISQDMKRMKIVAKRKQAATGERLAQNLMSISFGPEVATAAMKQIKRDLRKRRQQQRQQVRRERMRRSKSADAVPRRTGRGKASNRDVDAVAMLSGSPLHSFVGRPAEVEPVAPALGSASADELSAVEVMFRVLAASKVRQKFLDETAKASRLGVDDEDEEAKRAAAQGIGVLTDKQLRTYMEHPEDAAARHASLRRTLSKPLLPTKTGTADTWRQAARQATAELSATALREQKGQEDEDDADAMRRKQ